MRLLSVYSPALHAHQSSFFFTTTGLGTPSAAGTAHANHQLHQLLPRIHTRLAELLAIRAEAEAKTKSQAAPAVSQSQSGLTPSFTTKDAGSSPRSLSPAGAPVAPAPAPTTTTDSETTSSRSSSDSESEVQTPVDDIPIVLVTDHSDVVVRVDRNDQEEHAGMTSLSYHGNLSELAKEPASEKERREKEKGLVGPFRFPPPRCDVKELLSPQAIPRSMWTKKSRPAHAKKQRHHVDENAPISESRVRDIAEMSRLLQALTKQGSGKEYDEQRLRDRLALGLLMERMRREIEEKGCSRKEANMIMFEALKSVGTELVRKAEEAKMDVDVDEGIEALKRVVSV